MPADPADQPRDGLTYIRVAKLQQPYGILPALLIGRFPCGRNRV
jgi:hypothetical protein